MSIRSFDTGSTSTRRIIPNNWHLSISPDGKYILKFNNNKLQFKIIEMKQMEQTDEMSKSFPIGKDFPKTESQSKRDELSEFPLFRTALSNIVVHFEEDVIFVAISLVEENDMLSSQKKNGTSGKTVIYRMVKKSGSFNEYKKYKYKEHQGGGIVIFAHPDSDGTPGFVKSKIRCYVFNAEGIFRFTYYANSEKHKEQQFEYPKRLQGELERSYEDNSCLERIESCIFGQYFLIEQFNEGIQIIQLFNLITMEMEQIFQKRLDKHLYKTFSYPIFSISQNKFLLMFSKGIDTVLIFCIENGLELARKNFGNDVKILFGEFIKHDEALLLVIKPKKKNAEIVIWDLFSSVKNNVKRYEDDSNVVLEEITEIKGNNSRCPGNFLTINVDGEISKLWNLKEEVPQVNNYYKLIPPDESPSSSSYTMPELIAGNNKDHTIYRRKQDPQNDDKPLVNNKEPWVKDRHYKRISAYLDQDETIQLIIGRTTVQIWRKNEDDISLEYIWANSSKPRDEKAVLNVKELQVGDRTFNLKVTWTTSDGAEDKAEIKWPYSDGHVTAIRHICKALAHLNYRKYSLVGYKRNHKFEKIMNNLSLLIWRFIKKRPDVWKLMAIRYDVMSSIIIGGSTSLVKYILFGEIKKEIYLHIPHIKQWDDTIDVKVVKEMMSMQDEDNNGTNQRKELTEDEVQGINQEELTDLEIAIRFCAKDRRIDRHVVIVGYLLEYYTINAARGNNGWLITVSKALPKLYKHKLLVHYAKEIFYKECFNGLELSHNVDYRDVIPDKIDRMRKHTHYQFIAFSPNRKLVEKTNLSKFEKFLEKYTKKYHHFFPNPFGTIPPVVRIVPLCEFATSPVVEKQLDDQDKRPKSFFLKLLHLIFIPRGYLTKKTSDLSPFVQIIRAEEEDDVFNNPTMEAAINYRWIPARNYFLRLAIIFILYATCFAVICGFYLSHVEMTGNLNNFLLFLIFCFYYLGFFLLFVEYRQVEHLGYKDYLQFFNLFDLIAEVLPFVIMSVFVTSSFKLSNGFADVVTTQDITVAISITMLILWFEFILYFRLLSETAKYIYIILNIIKESYIFLLFIFLVLMAFAHAMFILLQHPTFTNVTPKSNTFSLKNSKNKPMNVSMVHDFDPNDRVDNPNSNFGDSLISSYFWMGGAYVQNDTWDFWAVEMLTLLASVFVVTVLQNMFIAFMGGIYAEAEKHANSALLRFRAESVSDYEALDDIHFSPLEPDPKFIYYIGKPSSHKAWKEICDARKNTKLYSRYEKKIAEIKDLFVEENLKVKNSLWEWEDNESTQSKSS